MPTHDYNNGKLSIVRFAVKPRAWICTAKCHTHTRQVYRKFAEERESSGDYHGSIEYWVKSLGAARAAGDKTALGQACYRIGKAYTELEQPTR